MYISDFMNADQQLNNYNTVIGFNNSLTSNSNNNNNTTSTAPTTAVTQNPMSSRMFSQSYVQQIQQQQQQANPPQSQSRQSIPTPETAAQRRQRILNESMAAAENFAMGHRYSSNAAPTNSAVNSTTGVKREYTIDPNSSLAPPPPSRQRLSLAGGQTIAGLSPIRSQQQSAHPSLNDTSYLIQRAATLGIFDNSSNLNQIKMPIKPPKTSKRRNDVCLLHHHHEIQINRNDRLVNNYLNRKIDQLFKHDNVCHYPNYNHKILTILATRLAQLKLGVLMPIAIIVVLVDLF